MTDGDGFTITNFPKLKRDLRLLDCVLTDDELRARGAKLAEVTTAIGTEADHQKAVRDSQKSVMTALEAKQSELAAQINRGREVREIDVVTYADYNQGLAIDVRQDTLEVVLTRELVGAERQKPMTFAEEVANAVAAAPLEGATVTIEPAPPPALTEDLF